MNYVLLYFLLSHSCAVHVVCQLLNGVLQAKVFAGGKIVLPLIAVEMVNKTVVISQTLFHYLSLSLSLSLSLFSGDTVYRLSFPQGS